MRSFTSPGYPGVTTRPAFSTRRLHCFSPQIPLAVSPLFPLGCRCRILASDSHTMGRSQSATEPGLNVLLDFAGSSPHWMRGRTFPLQMQSVNVLWAHSDRSGHVPLPAAPAWTGPYFLPLDLALSRWLRAVSPGPRLPSQPADSSTWPRTADGLGGRTARIEQINLSQTSISIPAPDWVLPCPQPEAVQLFFGPIKIFNQFRFFRQPIMYLPAGMH